REPCEAAARGGQAPRDQECRDIDRRPDVERCRQGKNRQRRNEPREERRVQVRVDRRDRRAGRTKNLTELLQPCRVVHLRPPPSRARLSRYIEESEVSGRRVARDLSDEMWDLKRNRPCADQRRDRHLQRRQATPSGRCLGYDQWARPRLRVAMSKGAMVNAADTIFASQAAHLARRPWAQADEEKVA